MLRVCSGTAFVVFPEFVVCVFVCQLEHVIDVLGNMFHYVGLTHSVNKYHVTDDPKILK